MTGITQKSGWSSAADVTRPVADGSIPAGKSTGPRDQGAVVLSSDTTADDMDKFEKYLNQTSTMAVVKVKDDHQSDAVDMTSKTSVYLTPNLFSA